MSDEDREAVRRVQAGDSNAFEVLVEKYKRKTYRLAYQVLRNPDEALDVAQEAFVKAYRSLPTFKGDAAFYTWLFRITMNLALDRKRQRAVRARALGTEDVPPDEWERTAVATGPNPEHEAAAAERRRKIAQALGTLSDNHRTIVLLSDVEGLSYREIAATLDVPLGTVMSRLHNARKRLRAALGPGFLALALAAALVGMAAISPARAEGPSGATPEEPAVARQVCVFVLVMLASDGPAEGLDPRPGSSPGPGAAAPSAPPEAAPEGDAGDPAVPAPECGHRAKLHPWLPRLRGLFGYSTFEPLSAFETLMPFGAPQRFTLPGGRALEVEPLVALHGVVRMALRILRGPQVEVGTVMDVPSRRPAVIGGLPHGPGVLIIGLRTEQP